MGKKGYKERFYVGAYEEFRELERQKKLKDDRIARIMAIVIAVVALIVAILLKKGGI